MSNGAQNCALEICCPTAEIRRAKLPAMIAKFTGLDADYCGFNNAAWTH